MAGIYQTGQFRYSDFQKRRSYLLAPPPVPATDASPVEQHTDAVNPEVTETPAALGEDEGYNQFNILLYIIGLITIFVIFGVVAFIIIRKRKQKSETMEVTPANSIASSNISDV